MSTTPLPVRRRRDDIELVVTEAPPAEPKDLEEVLAWLTASEA